jgi:RNA polymerase sigma-70 factor (ECF subfamily)
VVDEDTLENIPSPEDSSFESLKNENSLLIEKAMMVLTEDQREVISLKFFSELSYEEISKIVGKNEDAVRALQCRALIQLRKYLIPIRQLAEADKKIL